MELNMPDDSVLFEVRDNVAHVTLNRPQAGNALDLEMAKQLMADGSCAAKQIRACARSCSRGQAIVFVRAVT